MAINYEDPARGQRALSAAFSETLQENATLRISGKAKDDLINEQRMEIARLTGMLTEAGVDPENPEAPADKPQPNRKARRSARKTGNGAAEAAA